MSQHYSDKELIEAAHRVANTYVKIANKRFNCKIPHPLQISFDLANSDPKCTGTASHNMIMSINMVLFKDNVEYILNNTIPHEIAHLVQYKKFQNMKGHGVEWQEIMRKFGKIPTKYHQLDISKSLEHFKAFKKKTKSKD